MHHPRDGHTATPLADVTSFLATYNMVAAPVVDAERRLVGVVSVDDVLDHLLPEDWRERPTGEVGAASGA